MTKAVITNIQGYSIHDGPGIRTTVFFKGCPLKCRWCANPECIEPGIQTGFIENLCIGCGKCAAICPAGAIDIGGERHRINYEKCTACGKCADVCDYNALVRYGAEMTPRELFDVVRRDKMFYDTSGGGVTVSGGEPLLHAEFVRELFAMCRDDGIDTCAETCGLVPKQKLLDTLPLTDHLLFDLKLMSPARHREYTGQSNETILENAALASNAGADILFRIPLIPGVNDDDENIAETARFVRSLPGGHEVQLMPYHRLGDSKYKALDMQNVMRDLQVMDAGRIEAVRQRYESLGVGCTVSR